MKRTLALLFALLMLALCSCGAIKDAVKDYVKEELSGAVEGDSVESVAKNYLDDELSTGSAVTAPAEPSPGNGGDGELDYFGSYTTKEDVAKYIRTYNCLPSNFITKKEAEALGWSGGSLEPYAPGKCIGGDHFGNFEGQLPTKSGRSYTECDIDTLGAKSRGAKRIVFSNDGLIFYTDDHYETFTEI